jgi:hypothetical protein
MSVHETLHIEAKTLKVEDLLRLLRQGMLRLPKFQRGLRWRREDNRKLFDSILRGYPMGSLLVWKQQRPAERVAFGPYEVDAPGRPDAWHVVDGQQRLSALAGALLASPEQRRPNHDFVVSLASDVEVAAAAPTRAEGAWVPLDVLGEPGTLLKWLHAHPAADVAVATHLSKRLREYPVPVILIEADDERQVKEVFERLNRHGKRLEAKDIFRAGASGTRVGDALDRAVSSGREFGFGGLDESNLIRALNALHGADPIEKLKAFDDGAAEQLVRGTREAVVLLRAVGVPHVSLLPYSLPLGVLAAFFARHGTARPRNRYLLGLWFWRSTLTFAMHGDFSTIRSLYRRAVEGSEDEAVQALLHAEVLQGWTPPRLPAPGATLRSAEGKVVTLVLIAQRPRHLVSGEVLAVDSLLERGAGSLLRVAVDGRRGAVPALALVHPALPRRRWVQALAFASDEVLQSHLSPVSPTQPGWAAARREALEAAWNQFIEQRAAPADSLRPPLSALGEATA